MKRENDRFSVLPMELDDGTRILCDSVSGGQDYTHGMPRKLTLLIVDPNGFTRRAEYVHCKDLGKGSTS